MVVPMVVHLTVQIQMLYHMEINTSRKTREVVPEFSEAILHSLAVMVEDIAQNLVPAAVLGMATVWVRGGRDLTLAEEQNQHVHHVTDDLPGWLLGLRA